jgi:hypothetical protein
MILTFVVPNNVPEVFANGTEILSGADALAGALSIRISVGGFGSRFLR